MFKQILTMASLVFITACSSGGDSSTITETPGGGNPPASGTKAGVYTGNFGTGNGVYVIDNDNAISGLALAADGSASSLFGNIGTGSEFSGVLRSNFHDASSPATQGVFGAGVRGIDAAGTSGDGSYNLNIVNGQSIESLSGPTVNLSAASAGDLTAASATALAGAWSGRHRYCGSNGTVCSFLVTEVNFSGTTVTGRTYIIDPEGAENFEFAIDGSITEFGDVALLSFTWAGDASVYNGVAFFTPGSSSQLTFIGEVSPTVADEGRTTIASLLTR